MNARSFIDKHFTLLYSLGFVTGLLLMFVYADNQYLRGDQTQMLYKGYLGAYAGTWLNFGNAASAVGNVPGSLSTWVIGGPLLLWDSPWAPMTLIILLRVISLFLFDAVIKQVFRENMRLVFLALYWLNPWLLYDSIVYNPSYLCLFAAMHLWSAFKMREKKSFLYSFIHVLAIGMAMQFHYSWPILAVISLYLFYRNMGAISWSGVVAAILTVAASLVPYFLEYMDNEALSRESDRYIGYGLIHVYPVLKAVLYWVRYGSLLFSNKAIANSDFDWATNIEIVQLAMAYSWKAFVFVIGGFSVIVAARCNWNAWKFIRPIVKRTAEVPEQYSWLILYAFAALLGVLISAALSPITFSYWHLILVYPFALLPIMQNIERWSLEKPLLFHKVFFAAVTYLLLVNLMASHDSLKYSYSVDYDQQIEAYIEANRATFFPTNR